MAEEVKTEVKEEEKETVVAEPEKATGEVTRDALLDKGKEMRGEKEAGKENEPPPQEEFEEYDWEELTKEYPQLEKLGYKDIKDVLSRHFGSLPNIEKEHQFIEELKKAGVSSPEAQKELLLKLKGGEAIKKEERTEVAKTFRDQRAEGLLSLIPKEVDGTPLEEKEITEQLKQMENFAEKIAPSSYLEAGNTAQKIAVNVVDRLEFLEWQLEKVFEKFKDEIISKDVKKEIDDYFKQYPKTAEEIAGEAIHKGNNYYPALYHYFILKTQGSEIEKKKMEKLLAEKEKELEKKLLAKTVEKKETREAISPSKKLSEMTHDERRATLLQKGKALHGF